MENPDLDNPYRSPIGEAASYGAPGRAHHIPIVAILLMVQGGLELLFGGMMSVYGIIMGAVAPAGEPNFDPAGQGPPLPSWFFAGMLIAYGAVPLATGLLKVIAGWRNYFFRGKLLGIAALVGGMASVLTCYCFPTALALLIYGLIVYLSDQSAAAFALGKQGYRREQILTQWS